MFGRSAARNSGNPRKVSRDPRGGRGRDRGRVARLPDEAGDVTPAIRERNEDAIGIGDRPLDRVGLAAQDAQCLGGLAQARMRAAEHLREVLRTAGEAGAELDQNQPQPLTNRKAPGCWRRSRTGSGLRLPDRHLASVRQPLAGVARLAVHEVLADQRLWAHLATRVLAQLAQARLRDLDDSDGLRGSSAAQLEALDDAGAHAGDSRSPPSESPNALSNTSL